MSFFVDIVSEDSFYENLTLGVSKLLEASPCVRNVQLERRGGCDRSVLSTWEQKHCCLLTEDLRNFYTATDGFLLTWSLEISGEEFPIGRMEIKELSSLKRHIGVATSKDQQADGTSSTSSSSSSLLGEGGGPIEPTFGGARCKLFELAECAECKVFLAYQLQPDQDEPSVWLYDPRNGKWHLLADSFCKYFRMMLVHLGLPQWQMCAANLQLPTWLEQVYLLVGPHLLQTRAPPLESSASLETSLWNDGPTNLIDPAVFRSKEHHHTVVGGSGVGGKQKTSGNATGSTKKKSSSH